MFVMKIWWVLLKNQGALRYTLSLILRFGVLPWVGSLCLFSDISGQMSPGCLIVSAFSFPCTAVSIRSVQHCIPGLSLWMTCRQVSLLVGVPTV